MQQKYKNRQDQINFFKQKGKDFAKQRQAIEENVNPELQAKLEAITAKIEKLQVSTTSSQCVFI